MSKRIPKPSEFNAATLVTEATRFSFLQYQQQRAISELLTGLHPNDVGSNVWATVEAQAKKIAGLRTHMACMARGYGRKIKKLEKKLEIALAASDLTKEELDAGYQNSIRPRKARPVEHGRPIDRPAVLPQGANGAGGGQGSAI
jgi:hypothetical protein